MQSVNDNKAIELIDLPPELLAYIFSFLGLQQMAHVRRVSSQFKEIIAATPTPLTILSRQNNAIVRKKGTYAEVVAVLKNRDELNKKIEACKPSKVDRLLTLNARDALLWVLLLPAISASSAGVTSGIYNLFLALIGNASLDRFAFPKIISGSTGILFFSSGLCRDITGALLDQARLSAEQTVHQKHRRAVMLASLKEISPRYYIA